MPTSILVPLDCSNFAEHAVPHALRIARRTGATLHFAHVHIPLEIVDPVIHVGAQPGRHDRALQEGAADYIATMIQRAGDSGVTAIPAMLTGRVASTLARYAEEAEIGLVVMTTHGRGGIQRVWLGSTADGLVRRLSAPILLVRPAEASRAAEPEAPAFHTALAALDGGDMAERALRYALEDEVIQPGTRLVLARVVQPPLAAPTPYIPHAMQLAQEMMDAREQAARGYLAALAASEWLRGWTVEPRVLVDPRPAHALLALADEVEADLVIVGTHSRGPLRRMVLGSVSDRIVRGTGRPVLVHGGTPAHEHPLPGTPHRYGNPVEAGWSSPTAR